MRIAVISDAVLPTPHPAGHGLGRMVSQLSEGLLRQGHDVTLFAKVGSTFSGPLVMPPEAKGYEGEKLLAKHCMAIHYENPFDVVFDHSHIHHIAKIYPDMPVVNVFHDMWQAYARNAVLPSEGVRALMPQPFHSAVIIPNALPPDDFPLGEGDGKYLAFLGAFTDYKNPLLAIEAAARFGMPLLMAGAPKSAIPFTPGCNTRYVGELKHADKVAFLGKASAFLQLGPVESFGLTSLEASLCGTPVVATPMGGNMDVVINNHNGVFVSVTGGSPTKNVCDALDLALELDRKGVRESAISRFDPNRQLRDYEDVLSWAAQGAIW